MLRLQPSGASGLRLPEERFLCSNAPSLGSRTSHLPADVVEVAFIFNRVRTNVQKWQVCLSRRQGLSLSRSPSQGGQARILRFSAIKIHG